MNIFQTALLSAVLLLNTASCSPFARAEPAENIQAASAAASDPVPPGKILTDAARLQQAQNELAARAEFAGTEIRVFEKINFFDGVFPRIELALQNPKQPESLLFYTYQNGTWQISEAEDIGHVKNLPRHLFALNSVRFADAAAYAVRWQQKADEVNAVLREPYYVAFILLTKQQKRFWHTATLEAQGAQYYLSFYEDGRIWEFKALQGGAAEKE